jgi:hypothetical protein
VNSGEPAANRIMDDRVACEASLAMLQGLEIRTVYPGHGEPFPMASFLVRRGTAAAGQPCAEELR